LFEFGDNGDIMDEGVRPPLDRPCSLLEPKPALRYGKVFLVNVILNGQSSILVEFVKVERVEFVFEDFVEESRLDGREPWVDPADFRGYLAFVLVIVIMFSVLLLLLNGVGSFQRVCLGLFVGQLLFKYLNL